MDALQRNIQFQKNYLVTMRTFEIGSIQEIIKSSFEGKDSQWKYNLVSNLSKFIDGVMKDFSHMKDLLNSHVFDHTLLVFDMILFNLFTKQKKEERQVFNNDMYDVSQQSMMSRFQNSEMSSVTVAHSSSQANQLFIENFKVFFFQLANNTEFFEKIEKLFNLHRPRNELKSALKSLVKTIQYIQFKESFNIPSFEDNIQPLISLSTLNSQLPNMKPQIDVVNKILFGPKLDKIVRILTSKENVRSQQEVHFAVGRIYFASHSRNRSNFNRNTFKQIKHTGRDLIYNIIRHYVVNQQPDKQKTQICSSKDTEKYPIPAFILNYLQLLFMPIYNQFQELFDKYIMEKYTTDQELFYSEIFPSTTQQIIPFLQNLPIEFCNFFTMFYQIISDNHDQFSDKMNDLFPVKQLFVNRFLLNPNLRQYLLPIRAEKEKDYIQALNWFSKLFYNNSKEEKLQSSGSYFLKLNSIIQDCFAKIVTQYHSCPGHVDVYNLYLVDPVLRKDYNLVYDLINIISFSEHEQKEYQLFKYRQNFPVKKRMEQKQQMDIIKEIATPINENISKKMDADESPKLSNPQTSNKQFFEEKPFQKGTYSELQENQGKSSSNIQSQQMNTQQSQQQQSNQQLQQLEFQHQQQSQQQNIPYNNAPPYYQSNSLPIQNFPHNFSNVQTPVSSNQNNNMVFNNNPNLLNGAPFQQLYSNNSNLINPNNNFQYVRGGGQSLENIPKTGEYQGMYSQGNYQDAMGQEESSEFLSQQLKVIKLKRQKLDEEQGILQRHIEKMEAVKDQGSVRHKTISNYFQAYSEKMNKKDLEDKIEYKYEQQLTDQFDQLIKSQRNNIELNEHKALLNDEVISLHQKNEFLKLFIKQRYPSQIDYIDNIDNKENIEHWKKAFDLEQKQQERREKRQKRNKEEDEFYYYQNIITQELKKVEEADLKLEIHKKIHAELL